MRVIISLILCSAILITGSSINESITHEKESIGHELIGNIEEEKFSGIEQQVRENRNVTDDGLPESHQDEDIDTQKISAPATTGKREVSTASAAASASTISNIDQSAFESKTNDIFSNILAEMRALMESAKIALLNLKSELSFGPQIGETYDENAAAESESLAFTQNEISSFMEHFPVLVQTLIEEPHQIWTVQDMVTASVPTEQISGSVGRLRNHILELLEVLRARLATNPQASNSVQTLEQYIASLQAQRFQVLDDLVARDDLNRDSASSSTSASAKAYSSASSSSASSSAVSYSNSQQTSESEERTEISETPENDSIIARKIKSLRALCTAIKRIPSLLIELPFTLKEGFSSLHANEGLCKKLKNHPIFSIPCLRALLPKFEETPEGSTEVQSTSVTSTASASSSASSVTQNVPDVARAIISPWLQSPSPSAASSSSDFEYGNRPEGGAITSAVARASAVAQTLPDRARSMISPFVQRSEASSSASSSANSFNFGDGRVPEVINSAVASASAAAQTLPDTARAAISPWIQGSQASSSASSSATSSNSFNLGNVRVPEVINSAVASATAAAQTLPDTARAAISPLIERSKASSSASGSATSSNLFGFDNGNRLGTGGISSAVASASSAAQTLPDTARSVISPLIQKFHDSGSPASNAAASSRSSYGSNSEAFSSAAARATSMSETSVNSPSFVSRTSQQKPCPICGLFSCLCHQKRQGHNFHPFRKPASEDEFSRASSGYTSSSASAAASSRTSEGQYILPEVIIPGGRSASSSSASASASSSGSFDRPGSQQKPCPKCGLFSCLCNKGPGHGIHSLLRPSSENHQSYLVPIPSAASSSRTSQQKPCPICGLFSCLGHHKGHGHDIHSLLRPSEDEFSRSSSSYTSSSASAAASSRTSEGQYISPEVIIPGGRSASSSSASASASSSGSFNLPGSQQKPCPKCGLFSCLCNKGPGHGIHSLLRPSSENHQSYLVPIPSATSSSRTSSQQKPCPICGLFSCLGHHKGHGHDIHSLLRPSEDEFSRSSSSYGSASASAPASSRTSEGQYISPEVIIPGGRSASSSSASASASSSGSFDRPGSQQKPCPKCGLFSCLCNKGHGHSFHPFKKPSSEDDRLYLVPTPSANYASSSASAASIFDTTSILQPSIQRTPSQQKPCPICGLFSCLCHKKGHGHNLYPFRKSASENEFSRPSSSYTSSSASAAASSRTSKGQYISPEVIIPGGRSASSSSASASASSSSSFDRPGSQHKLCPKCGLFSCLCNKGHGHSFHPFKKPSSEDDRSYLVPIPSATYASSSASAASSSRTSEEEYISPAITIPGRSSASSSSSSASASSSDSFDRSGCDEELRSRQFSSASAAAAASAQSFSDTTSIIQPSIQRTASHQKPCPICGLFSCLCHKKGDGHNFHPFRKATSEDEFSRPSSSYTSSSASAAASSRTSEGQYISPEVIIPGGRSASSSSASTSTSSSGSFDRPSSQQKPCPKCGLFSCLCHKGHGHSFHPFKKPSSQDDRSYLVPIPSATYGSSSASAASSSRTSEEDYISPKILIPVEKITTSSSSSASASSSASSNRPDCDAGLRSKEFTSASAAASASARSFSDTPSIIKPPIQRSQDSSSSSSTAATSTSSVSTSLSPSSSKVSPNEEQNHRGHGLTSLLGKVKSSCPLGIHKHRSHPLLQKCSKCGLLSCLHKNKAQSSDNSGQSYSPVPVTKSDSISTSSASSSSSSQEQVLNPVRCSPSAPSTSLRPSPQELQFSPRIRIPDGNSRSIASSSSTAYSGSSDQSLPTLSPRQREFYPPSNSRNSASAAATATSRIQNPTFTSDYPRPNQNIARRPSFRPGPSINRKTPSISSYIPDFSRIVPNYDESSRSSPESSTIRNPSFYFYIPNLSSLVPNFNSGSSTPLGSRPISAGSSGSRRPLTPNTLGSPRTSQESPNLGSKNLGSLPADDEDNNRDRTNSNISPANNEDNDRDRINSNRLAKNDENNRDRTDFDELPANNNDNNRDRTNSNRPAALSSDFRTGSSPSDDYYLNDNRNNSPNPPSSVSGSRRPSTPFDTSGTAQGSLNTGSRNSPLLAADDDENGLLRPATYNYKQLPNSDKFAVSPKASGDESSRYDGYDHNEEDNQSVNSRFSPSFSQGIRGSDSRNSPLVSANGGETSRDNVLRPATYGFKQLPNSDRFAASPPASRAGSSHYGGYDLHDELNEAEQRY